MKAKALPVTSFEDATLDFEQVQVFLTSGDITSDSTGRLARVSKINGTSIPFATSSWIAPALINSWANVGGANATAGYLKDPFGFVHLKGRVGTGVSGTVAFVLPAGFRPGATIAAGIGFSAGDHFDIDASGNATGFHASASISLDGTVFLAEN